MNTLELFSPEYIALKTAYLEHQLASYPRLRIYNTTKKGVPNTCIREIDKTTGKYRQEHLLTTPEGQALNLVLRQQNELSKKIELYKSVWRQKTAKPFPRISDAKINYLMSNPMTQLNTQYYDKLTHQAAVKEFGTKNHPYIYKNIPMRSKLENLVANVLDELDLEYKYESLYIIGNNRKFPDFTIPFRVLNFCFPLEVAGDLSSINYYSKFQSDMANYINAGFLPNRTLLVLSVTEENPIENHMVAILVSSYINNQVYSILTQLNMLDDLYE